MNAQHPFRALHGHLAAAPDAPSLDALAPVETSNDAGFNAGLLEAGLSALDQAAYALASAVANVDRAVTAGAGQGIARRRLEAIAERIADASLATEIATARLTARLSGERF